ncbi:MAG: phage holin family protein [bacterium]|nr:phage holin family protein [bacterium]
MDDYKKVFDLAIAALTTVAIALLGNFARYLRFHRNEPFSTSELICGFLVVVFMALMIHGACQYYQVNSWLTFVLGGMCGYMGGHILDEAAAYILKRIRAVLGADENA